MKLSYFLKKIDFHDSRILSIYASFEKRVIMEIELCNWRQRFYEKTEPEIKKVRVVFNEVNKFTIEPNLKELPLHLDEILVAETMNTNNDGDFDTIKIITKPLDKDIRTIVIKAKDVFYKDI